MYTLSRKPIQLRLAGVALAIVALVAVLLAVIMTTGGLPALAATGGPAPEGTETGGGLAQNTQSSTPDACSATTKAVVDQGHIAIFDIYWDTDNKVLVNNPCPPAVTYETETRTIGTGRNEKEVDVIVGTNRGAVSEADIGQTIFHVRQQAMHVLTEDEVGTEADKGDYYLLGSAGDTVWLLPKYNTEHLDIGFSAGLLDPDDWNDLDFEFEAIREPGLNPTDRGRMYVFSGPGAQTDEASEEASVVWDSQDADSNEIALALGGYQHYNWAFTKAGTYVIAVHVKAHANNGSTDSQFYADPDDPVAQKEKLVTATSEVRRYTFHVGPLADLAVTVVAADTAPAVNTDINLTVTASNAGPDSATNTEVQVNLPAGLTYSTHSTASGTYDSATGVWSVGDLASGATETLTVTATVGANSHGQDLETTATILARETIGSSTVLELDPDESDNTAAATVTPVSEPNQEPMFLVERSVPENAHHDLAVGDPVPVSQGDGDALTYQLTGDGADKFYAESVAGGAQIKVYGQAGLDYETVSAYNLVLGVSDGKDAYGNADSSIGNSVAVKVSLQDIDETVTATLAAERAGNINTYTYTVTNLPSDATQIFYRFALRNTADPRVIAGSGGHSTSPITDSYTYGSGEYVVTGTVKYVSGGATHYISTDSVTLTIP